MQFANRFFFNDTATTEIYTLSLRDALPICRPRADRRRPGSHVERAGQVLVGRQPARPRRRQPGDARRDQRQPRVGEVRGEHRSEEHTSELQSRQYLVCRLLLEKTKYIPTSV